MSIQQTTVPDTEMYTGTARVLHWITAILVLSVIPAGIIMDRIEEGQLQDTLFNLHKSFGAILIPLVVLRVIWRLTHTPPPLPTDVPAPQRLAASLTHYALYVLLIVQPMLGWIASSAYRAPVEVFNVIELPPIWPENRALSEQMFFVHTWIGYTMGALLVAHIGGALYHHFIRGDNILKRMWR
jgi:cytochrome b561